MKKILTILLLTAITLFFLNCNGQNKMLGESPLILDKFDFDTDITTLFPAKNITKKNNNIYKIPFGTHNLFFIKDTIVVYNGSLLGDKLPVMIQYRKTNFLRSDTVAVYEKFPFNSINLATTMENKIMMINGLVEYANTVESIKIIDLLDKNYGNHIKSKGNYIQPFDIYTWTLQDRIIKYSIVNIDHDETSIENNTVQNREEQMNIMAYLFIIKKEYANKTIGRMYQGDLVYCQ